MSMVLLFVLKEKKVIKQKAICQETSNGKRWRVVEEKRRC
jgi:hypothetical protein